MSTKKPAATPSQNYINHIALVIDESGSMDSLREEVIKVADNQIKHLAQRSTELDQETRVTVYTFSANCRCLFYDKDVLRLPSLRGLYNPSGGTALIDATVKALEDLAHTPQLYGDHAFLAYVITDGQENQSFKHGPADLRAKLGALKDNWTVAAFVPDASGKFEAKKFGFPADNIAIWDATSKGMSEVGEVIRKATDAFMSQRSTGVRGYKSIFNLADAVANVSVADVRSLPRLGYGQYRVVEVRDDGVAIAPFVERETGRPYRLGEAYYQLSKPEKIQASKVIALRDKKTGEVFSGTEARKLLGLPDQEVKVAPASHPAYELYVQSTSVNRKLVAGTKLILMST